MKNAWELAQGSSTPAAAPAEAPEGEEPPAEDAPAGEGGDEEAVANPKDAGYRIEIKGHHFHNAENDPEGRGGTYVQRTLIEEMLKREVDVFTPADVATKKVRIVANGSDPGLGIENPVLTYSSQIKSVPNPAFGRENQQNFTQPEQIQRFDFTLEFWWRPTTESDRKRAIDAAKQNGEGAEADPTATAAVSGTNEVQ